MRGARYDPTQEALKPPAGNAEDGWHHAEGAGDDWPDKGQRQPRISGPAGNYVGQNFGVITTISEGEINLKNCFRMALATRGRASNEDHAARAGVKETERHQLWCVSQREPGVVRAAFWGAVALGHNRIGTERHWRDVAVAKGCRRPHHAYVRAEDSARRRALGLHHRHAAARSFWTSRIRPARAKATNEVTDSVLRSYNVVSGIVGRTRVASIWSSPQTGGKDRGQQICRNAV